MTDLMHEKERELQRLKQQLAVLHHSLARAMGESGGQEEIVTEFSLARLNEEVERLTLQLQGHQDRLAAETQHLRADREFAEEELSRLRAESSAEIENLRQQNVTLHHQLTHLTQEQKAGRIEQQSAEMEQLKEAVAALTKERDLVQKKVENCVCLEMRGQLSSLEEEKKKVDAQVAELEEEAGVMGLHLDSLDAENRLNLDEIARLRSLVRAKEDALDHECAERQQEQRLKEELEKKVASLEQNYSALLSTHTPRKPSLPRSASSLEEELRELRTKSDEMQNEKVLLEQQLCDAQISVGTLQRQLNQLQKQLDQEKEENLQVAQAHADTQQQLKSQLREACNQKENAEVLLLKKDIEFQAVSDKVKTLSSAIDDMNAQATAVEEENLKFKKDNLALQRKNTSIHEESRAIQQECNRLRSEIKTLTLQLERNAETLSLLEKEREWAHQTLSSTPCPPPPQTQEGSLQLSEVEIRDLRRKLTRATDDLTRAKTRIAHLEKEKKEKSRKITQLKMQCDMLEEEKASLRFSQQTSSLETEAKKAAECGCR
eukprot:GCRY01008295.1.p1 GENE.GCRY01008295.1~~GCRY01008295.1.p1  ORF type:complete len:547 (+),score=158.83 GCRY01008295.1:166-1806(+)